MARSYSQSGNSVRSDFGFGSSSDDPVRIRDASSIESEAKAKQVSDQETKNRWVDMNDNREELMADLESKISNEFKPSIVGGKGGNPNLTAPWSFSGDYQRKVIDDAPTEIKSALIAFFEAHNDDGDGLQDALDEAYSSALVRKIKIFDPALEGESKIPKDLTKIPNTKEHDTALANMDKAERYISRLLANAKRDDMRFDEDGNERL